VRAGFTRPRSLLLDRNARGLSGTQVNEAEADHIRYAFDGGTIPQDGARGGRDLRLHAGGDVASTRGAKALSGAAEDWKRRGGGSVWTFTHRWRQVARHSFGAISVLASCESTEDAKRAQQRGYVPALVLRSFPSERAFDLDGLRVIPCPAETRGTTCVQCRLCLDREQHLRASKSAIGFALHGRQAAQVRLPVLRGAA